MIRVRKPCGFYSFLAPYGHLVRYMHSSMIRLSMIIIVFLINVDPEFDHLLFEIIFRCVKCPPLYRVRRARFVASIFVSESTCIFFEIDRSGRTVIFYSMKNGTAARKL